MLVEKEVIRPGKYWYIDETTGKPRVLDATPELTRYWHEQGNKMISLGLPIPVPFEHDFDQHPMTAKEKLLNNAGDVKEYRLKNIKDKKGNEVKDVLFSVVDVRDEEVAKKLPRTIRWTSPWINSFVDGSGRKWNNVISHLALTTRPRIVEQQPFSSIAAALSVATETRLDSASAATATGAGGLCLSRAGLLTRDNDHLLPRYPLAFSLWGGGIALADFPPKASPKTGKGKAAPAPAEPVTTDNMDDEERESIEGDDDFGEDDLDLAGLMNPTKDSGGDIKMEELLCDLLQALGVPMPDESNEAEFKRHLYEAAMSKIKELTSKGMGGAEAFKPDQNKPPTQQPNAAKPNPTNPAQNPLIPQQEQQPLYMSTEQPIMAKLSLDDINKIEDSTMRTVALAMYNENEALRQRVEASERSTNAWKTAELEKATKKRADRVAMLGRLSPKAKPRLDAMLSLQGYALSMGDDGKVVDPMRETLDLLEEGLANLPTLLTTDTTALSAMPHPRDDDRLTPEAEDKLADEFALGMGCMPKAG